MPSIHKILVLIVLADTTRHVVHQAASLARRFHAEVILLHVVTRFSCPAGILERGHEITGFGCGHRPAGAGRSGSVATA
jgi:nucleotide-binding universal stress UspA family protein